MPISVNIETNFLKLVFGTILTYYICYSQITDVYIGYIDGNEYIYITIGDYKSFELKYSFITPDYGTAKTLVDNILTQKYA